MSDELKSDATEVPPRVEHAFLADEQDNESDLFRPEVGASREAEARSL